MPLLVDAGADTTQAYLSQRASSAGSCALPLGRGHGLGVWIRNGRGCAAEAARTGFARASRREMPTGCLDDAGEKRELRADAREVVEGVVATTAMTRSAARPGSPAAVQRGRAQEQRHTGHEGRYRRDRTSTDAGSLRSKTDSPGRNAQMNVAPDAASMILSPAASPDTRGRALERSGMSASLRRSSAAGLGCDLGSVVITELVFCAFGAVERRLS